MVPRAAYPPGHHHPHLTDLLTPGEAQSHLSSFLQKTQTNPYLHPDSLLSSAGISYSAHSGPTGGLAIHHLARIEAGLRGENLVVESAEELARQFDVENDKPEGDDSRLDELIGRQKRKRREAEIEDWVEKSSQSGFDELESFATTPLHQSDVDGVWAAGGGNEFGDEDENEQQEAISTLRDAEDEDGEKESKKAKSGADKDARKAAKRARKDARRREKAERAAAESGLKQANAETTSGAEDEDTTHTLDTTKSLQNTSPYSQTKKPKTDAEREARRAAKTARHKAEKAEKARKS